MPGYALDRWIAPGDSARAVLDATTGEPVGQVSSDGLDFAAMLEHARSVGGPALRRMTFHQRALMVKAMAKHLNERKEGLYTLSASTGATRKDSWVDIDGGITTAFVYASKARRELPDEPFFVDGPTEVLSREGTFLGRHICVPLEGAAIHINAFNFPVWGLLEKLAPALIAGMPVIAKPATQTCYLTQVLVAQIIDSGLLPPGALQLICGSAGDLLDHVTCQDVVAFTGSAATGMMLKQRPAIVNNAVRFTMEADSLNCSVLGPDAGPGTPEFDLYVKELVREMTTKAGQKCTATRRAIVPAAHCQAVVEAVQARLAKTVLGDPRLDAVRMGPLVSLDQRREVHERIGELAREGEVVLGGQSLPTRLEGADPARGAFVAPTLLYCPKPLQGEAVHSVEAFGPVSTLMPYDSVDDAIALAAKGGGSLVGSLFTHDREVAADIVLGMAAWHGRVYVVDRDSAKEATGHGSPLPHLIHGGPGRAGGGEELGGMRGVLHYLQRAAVQGSPDVLSAVCRRYVRGAATHQDSEGLHPFRKRFEALRVGESLVVGPRKITEQDVEAFAALSGDRFYAHMDSDAAKANPFFDERVAHGYFLVSAAAGMFVDPAPGPVLANYGLEDLRFLTPVYFGDEITVHFTCEQKTMRYGQGYGEVRWAVDLRNQHGEIAASYTVLTLVDSEQPAAH
ncbi:MAG: phenylacetic acid degradation bifunctional protein PaaZ [Pseudomonadota bacterium]